MHVYYLQTCIFVDIHMCMCTVSSDFNSFNKHLKLYNKRSVLHRQSRGQAKFSLTKDQRSKR